MKQLTLALAITAVFGLSACSSTGNKPVLSGNGITPQADAITPIEDRKLSTDFKEEGLKITYTTGGVLESIEVIGTAPVAKAGQYKILAQMDASAKLVEFIHGTNNKVDKHTRVLAKAISNASDKTLNRMKSVEGTIETTAADLEKELANEAITSPSSQSRQADNTARRIINDITETVTTLNQTKSSQGKLRGVRFVEGYVTDEGRTYNAVYKFERKAMTATRQLGSEMNQ